MDAPRNLLRREVDVQQRARAEVLQEPRACDRGGRVQLELVVVELGFKRLELLRGARDTLGELGPGQPDADRCGKGVPPLAGGIPGRTFPHLGDDVRIVVAGEPLDEIPSSPQRSQPEETDREAAEEKGSASGGYTTATVTASARTSAARPRSLSLRAAQLPDSRFGVFDSSCVHGMTNCPGAGAGLHPCAA